MTKPKRLTIAEMCLISICQHRTTLVRSYILKLLFHSICRDIPAGAELTFNYNFCAHGQDMLNCRCGSEGCVGYLGARPEPVQSAVAASAHPPSNNSAMESTSNSNNNLCGVSVGGGIETHKPSTIGTKKCRSGANAAPSSNDAEVSETGTMYASNRHEKTCYRLVWYFKLNLVLVNYILIAAVLMTRQ